jgi:hypothetical protein
LLGEPESARAIPALLLWPYTFLPVPRARITATLPREPQANPRKAAQGHKRYFMDPSRNVKSMTPVRGRFFQKRINYDK